MKRVKKLLALSVATGVLWGTVSTASAAEVKDFFDAKYYAGRYEDLKAAFGEDEAALWEHYLTFGIKEGRSASANFDVQKYRDSYVDLQKTFGSEWPAYLNHYMTYGISEGRDGGGEFDAASYADRHSDLKAAFGYDYDKLYDHYQTYGQKEGRNALSQVVMEERLAVAYAEQKAEQNVDDSGESGEEPLPGPGQQQPDGEYREDFPDGSYMIYEVENNVTRKETYYTADDRKEVINIYNSGGSLTELMQFDTITGEMMTKDTNIYDAAGNLIEEVSLDVANDFTVRHVYEYENGLNTQVLEYHNDVFVGKMLYTYNEQKQQVKEVRINNCGETSGITTYEYYTSGERKKQISYYGDSDKIEMVYEYYENGYTKLEVFYDSEGTKIHEVIYDEQGNETYRYPAE